jgi:PAS domain S-box-containing protein
MNLSRDGPAQVKILLVDDQPADRLALKAILEGLDVAMVEAHSGEDTLRVLLENEIAVVLLDLQLPGVGGFETAKLIRGREDARHTPIIFLTAHDIDRAIIEKAYALGAVDLLEKPLMPVVLRTKVMGFVELFRHKQQIQARAAELRASQERFRLLVDGTKDHAIFMLDPTGRIISWNPGAERIKQYQASEIVGQHFSRFYPQEAVERGWPDEELRRATAEGRFEDEGWRVRRDGSRFWASVVITALWDDGGNLRGFSKITRDLTERRQAEENARRLLQEETARRTAEQFAQVIEGQREQLRVTLTSIGDAVITTDADGRVTLLNRVAETLTGWSNEDARSQPLQSVLHIVNELTRQPLENPVAKVITTGRIVGLANHTLLIDKDGTERPIDDSAAPIHDAEGRVLGTVLVFRDVTERRRTEKNLQESEERSRHLLEFHQAVMANMGEGLYAVDAQGLVSYMNPAAEAMFGWTFEELKGRRMHDLTHYKHPDGTPFAIEECSGFQVLHKGVVLRDHEDVFIRKAGSFFPVVYSSSPLRSGEKTVGLVVVFRDITERKHAEQAMADARAYAQSIVDTVREPLLVLDGELRVKSASRSFYRTFGVTREETENRPIYDLGDRQWDIADLRNRLAEILPRNTTLSDYEVAQTFPGIGHRVMLLSARRLYREGNHTGLILLTIEDVTIEKEAEKRAYQLMIQLKDADRRKDEFLAILAHELRGPLAPLGNMLEIMRRADCNDDLLQQARNTMEKQLGQLVRLVDDLIDVSRITRNKIELRKELVELASVIHQSVESCRPLAEIANHQLSVTLPPEPVYLHADPVRLAQVFGNILNNACKYTEPGGKFWLAAERQGSDVVVTVKDNGMGIPADKLGSVFEMFTQVERTLERSAGGLGIGLTLTKRLVEMHDGTVTAHSEGPGRGSEFVVRLPVLAEKLTDATPEPTAKPTALPRRILVVDDNPDSASSLAMLLQITGNETHTAHDGLKAVEAAEKHRPDVILLDIGLPKLNGYDACRRIREEPWGKNMVLVALTGWGQEEDRRKSIAAGFDGHLVKPVDYATLMKLLAELSDPARK